MRFFKKRTRPVPADDVSSPEPDFHGMEVEHEREVKTEELRRDSMSDSELREDLECQYGKTKWALKLINELILKRVGRAKRGIASRYG